MRVPADGCGELPVPTYKLYAGTEVLGGDGARAVLGGLSTRCYPVGLEALSPRRRPRRSPPVSREFVAITETALAQLLAADLTGLELVALMVDGVRFGRVLLRCRAGHSLRGGQAPLTVIDEATEGVTVVCDLLVGLREGGRT